MGDTTALLEQLRQHERRNDHADCIAVCEALIAAGEWRPVWDLAVKWLDVARGMAGVPDGRSGRMPIPNNVSLSAPPLARHAADVFRLFAPMAGCRCCSACGSTVARWWDTGICTQCGAIDTGGALVPNPLPRYVEALRVWRPDNWFSWLVLHWDGVARGETVCTRHYTFLRKVVANGGCVVSPDGRVECGSTCPELPIAREETEEELRC